MGVNDPQYSFLLAPDFWNSVCPSILNWHGTLRVETFFKIVHGDSMHQNFSNMILAYFIIW